jgi:hypothetical protein
MVFAKWVFRIAGIYGLLVLLPQYFLEAQIGRDNPPAITHPEYFYGFVGVAIAWQIVFLIIARDPIKYRLLMLPAVIEKATFSIAVFVLFAQGRVSNDMLAAGSIDFVLGVLFVVAYRKSVPQTQEPTRTAQ